MGMKNDNEALILTTQLVNKTRQFWQWANNKAWCPTGGHKISESAKALLAEGGIRDDIREALAKAVRVYDRAESYMGMAL